MGFITLTRRLDGPGRFSQRGKRFDGYVKSDSPLRWGSMLRETAEISLATAPNKGFSRP